MSVGAWHQANRVGRRPCGGTVSGIRQHGAYRGTRLGWVLDSDAGTAADGQSGIPRLVREYRPQYGGNSGGERRQYGAQPGRAHDRRDHGQQTGEVHEANPFVRESWLSVISILFLLGRRS
jgi:hypothetical protein